jgi:hypothetical protein
VMKVFNRPLASLADLILKTLCDERCIPPFLR